MEIIEIDFSLTYSGYSTPRRPRKCSHLHSWQSSCPHGPLVRNGGKRRVTHSSRVAAKSWSARAQLNFQDNHRPLLSSPLSSPSPSPEFPYQSFECEIS